MIRVLHVMAYPPKNPGGVEIYVSNLTRILRKKNVYCEIVTTDLKNPIARIEKSEGVKVHYLKNYGSLWNKNPLFSIVGFLLKNYKKFDLLHIHSYLHFSSIQATILGKILRIPMLLTLHGGIQTKGIQVKSSIEEIQLLFKNLIFDKILGHLSLRFPNFVVSVSKEDLFLISQVFNVKRENNYYIPNAVDTAQFRPIECSGDAITFIGRLGEIKGFDLFIEIMNLVNKSLPNVPIIVLGEGKLWSLLYKYKLNIDYVKRIPHSKIGEIYAKTKLFVISSRFEGLPTTILEAMAQKIPIVSTNVGGIPQVISHGINGYLYSPNDIETAKNLIISLFSDENIVNQFREQGYTLVQEKYSWNKIAEKNIRLYKLLVGDL